MAARQNGFYAKQSRKIAFESVRAYQDAMAYFAAMGNLAVWYASIDVDNLQQPGRASSTSRAGADRQ